jgi:serine phosphatase RsbU (regulator of sigma subunit)/ligand-binding sensor domain-containing protein
MLTSISVTLAQNKRVHFEIYTTRDGLSQNNVYSIVQDNLGFIWMGTEDGLNRYDGYNFKVFKKDPNDTLSISSNYIQKCFISRAGTLWLGSDLGGLNRFDASTESFKAYMYDFRDPGTICSNNIRAIHEDLHGNLWIGSNDNKFDYFDIKSDNFIHAENMVPQDYEFDSDEITFIHHDKSNRLWVGSPSKVHLFSVSYSEKGVPRLASVKLKNQNSNSYIITIKETEAGLILIGTVSDGLFYLDENDMSLKNYWPNKEIIDLSDMDIGAIESDSEGNIWLAGITGRNPGLVKINKAAGTSEIYSHDPGDAGTISSNRIFSLFKDRTGVLWVGTVVAGVNKYDKSLTKFSLITSDPNKPGGLSASLVRGIYEDANGNLWIGSTGGGISVLNRRTGEYSHYRRSKVNRNSLSSNNVKGFYEDESFMWIGTNRGLNRFDKRTKSFRVFYVDSANISSGTNNINYNIIELPNFPGYLWFGTSGGGLVRFDKHNYKFKKYIYDPENENSFNNRDNFVRYVFHSMTRPDEIWTGTTHGINILNIKTEKFRYYIHDPSDSTSLSHQNVMHFYEDEEGYIWISVYGGGLNRFDPSTEKFKRFIESNSNIPNNGVYSALPDDDGNLWLSTNNGISRFNKKTFEFRNYSVDDGLQSEEYNGGANGELFFGGVNGLNYFSPRDVTDNQFVPEIAITDLRIFNESIKFGEDSPIKSHISEVEEIELSHWQNDISFEFVALHYANAPKNQYSYKLENYEIDWRFAENLRVATYTNLDPGEYIFKVKGSNSDGVWNDEGKSVKMTIYPPWWRTNIAYGGYFVLLVLFIFSIDRFQRHRLINIEQRKAEIAVLEAENKRKSEELEEARTLQLSMLPKELPELPHLDIAVYMQTATEVGGDYYDFNVGMDGTLTVVLGDATGHGMKAGTMVTTTKSLFNVLAPNPNIVETFHEMTRCLKLMHLEKLSMCMTMLKIMGNKLQMSAAGMPPVFIYKRENRTIEEHVMKGMPLGSFTDFPYVLEETNLNTGDTILISSDGYPELFNSEKELFGYKRMRNLFEEVANENPEDIISRLKEEGSNWTNDAPPDDDVTFVVIKVK